MPPTPLALYLVVWRGGFGVIEPPTWRAIEQHRRRRRERRHRLSHAHRAVAGRVVVPWAVPTARFGRLDARKSRGAVCLLPRAAREHSDRTSDKLGHLGTCADRVHLCSRSQRDTHMRGKAAAWTCTCSYGRVVDAGTAATAGRDTTPRHANKMTTGRQGDRHRATKPCAVT